MKFKFLTTLFLLALFAFSVQAQEPAHKIKFEKTTHDFGTLDQGAPCATTFKFANTSEAPIKLTNVKASCGCTTPNWPREAIAPGESAEIKVSYDSKRIGNFNKSIRVMYEGSSAPIVLFIKGKINQTTPPPPPVGETQPVPPIAPVEPALPKVNYGIVRGGLSFEKVIENIKEVTSDQKMTVVYKVRNTSTAPITILTAKVDADPEIRLLPTNSTLTPGQEGLIRVEVDGSKMKELNRDEGYFSKRITFYTDEATDPAKQITVNGNYKRILSALERENAPVIVFEEESVNGGKLIEGEKFVYDFTFKNEGKSPLMLTNVKASCGCTTPFWPKGEEIAPGETGKVTVSFNSKGRIGNQTKSVTVRSNDPDTPTKILKFSVQVVKDPFHAGSIMGGSN